MANEIERKFFVKRFPELFIPEPIRYERYFLERKPGLEIRIQRKGDKFFYEKKIEISDLERSGERKEISEGEFESLKKNASQVIMRDKFIVSENPEIAIQVYDDRFAGLVRAEIEFDSVEEAKAFVPLEWMGEEMTGLPIARDSKLLDLTDEEFRSYLK